MSTAKTCPLCGSEKLTDVLRNWRFKAEAEGDSHEIRGVTAYRCENGHVFMIVPETFVRKIAE
jgi:hypothetical protein